MLKLVLSLIILAQQLGKKIWKTYALFFYHKLHLQNSEYVTELFIIFQRAYEF